MSDKPPPKDKLASQDATVDVDEPDEETIEELEQSELGRTLESATEDTGDGNSPSGPPPLEIIDAAAKDEPEAVEPESVEPEEVEPESVEPEEVEPEEVEPEEVEPEEDESEEAAAPEDRPTIPRDALTMADLADDGTKGDDAGKDDETSGSGPKSCPPRPKSVKPPAPLPGPAQPKPLSRAPLPPPPPPPDVMDKTEEARPEEDDDDEGKDATEEASTEMADGPTEEAAKADDRDGDEPLAPSADDEETGAEEGEAPTERIERGTVEAVEAAGEATDENDDGEGAAAAPKEDEPGPPRETTPSIPDDDPAVEQGPPGIPSLVQPDPGQKKRREPPPRRRRGRKGKRSTVKIPDDSVPPVAEGADEPATDGETTAEASGETPAMPEAETPPADDDGKAGSEPQAKEEPDAAAGDDKPADDAKGDSSIFTDDQSIAVVRPIQVMSDLPPVEPTKGEAGDLPLADIIPEDDGDQPTPSPGGTVGSSPPGSPPPKGAVTSSQPPSGRRPPPPRRSNRPQKDEEDLDGIEEVIPDRMSLPGLIPDLGAAEGDSPNVTEAEPHARRPLPPPRGLMSSDPNLQVPVDPTPVASTPGDVDAFAGEDDVFAAAEAAAKAAEQAAKEAEELRQRAEQAAKDAAAKAEAARKAAEAKKKRPWWVQIFEDDLVRTQDNPRKKDVELETSFIEQSLRLEKGSRVLDLACGPGVHAVELASRGYQMVGVDLSSTMLALANDYNGKRGTAVSFIQGDMRKLNLEDVFDGIYCWSSSFGYFDEQANIEVLKRVARALRTGGRFALDVINRDFVAPRSPSMAWFEKPGCVCMDEMKFDFYTSRMITKRMVMFEDGRSTELDMSIRLYTLHELGKLLGRIGLKVIEVSGHRAHRTAYFGCESPRIIITSEKQATES